VQSSPQGLPVARVEIDPGGKIVIVTESCERVEPGNALDQWIANHARQA
jgi:hypothetical protein